MIVGTHSEKEYFSRKFPDIPCVVISATVGRYPAFSYKPFALVRYIDKCGLDFNHPDVVICDADILWNHNPSPLFSRFSGLCWVHKITAVDPTDFDLSLSEVEDGNIGIRTILHYQERYEIDAYPNFLTNAGLFMLPQKILPLMLENWMEKILRLPPNEMLMSEALMSLTYAEMGLTPTSDNVKYFGRHLCPVQGRSIAPLQKAEPIPNGFYSGYETATHYYGNQRHQLHNDAVTMGVDYDKLVYEIKARVLVKRLMRLLKNPSRILRRILKP
jgi:hypothetical protein